MESMPAPSLIAKRVIDAFGGLTKMHESMKAAGTIVPISTIHSWSKSERGIPRWHRRHILSVAASTHGVALPEDCVKALDA